MSEDFMPRVIPPPTGEWGNSIFSAVGITIESKYEEPSPSTPEKFATPLDPPPPFRSHMSSTHTDSSLTLNDGIAYSESMYSGDDREVEEKPGSSQPPLPSIARTRLIVLTIIMIISLTALDATILSTVTPTLVQIWGQASDIGWYGSVYLLPQPVLQPLFGKLYPYLNTKYALCGGLFLFEIGSLIAGIANGSITFIMGRAVAGVGASMITPGISLVITDILTKEQRPIVTGIAAMIGGTAACVGPILGGVFVTHASWRWSFFINLPLGFAAGVLFWLLYKPIKRETRQVSWWRLLCTLDPIGCILLMSTVLTLLLAFTFAAQNGWNQPSVIALLVFSATHLVAFVIEQYYCDGENALLPRKILKKKAIVLCAIFGFCIEAGSTLHSYFLPTYFQGVKNESAQASGISTLPQLLAQTLAGLATGIVINAYGRFNPPMLLGTIMFTVGSGLLLSLRVDTRPSQLIGFQILSGFGTGCCMFMAMGIAQQRLDRDEESIGLSMVYMVKTLGS